MLSYSRLDDIPQINNMEQYDIFNLKNLLFMAVAQFVQHEKEFPKPRNVERTTIQFHTFLYHII